MNLSTRVMMPHRTKIALHQHQCHLLCITIRNPSASTVADRNFVCEHRRSGKQPWIGSLFRSRLSQKMEHQARTNMELATGSSAKKSPCRVSHIIEHCIVFFSRCGNLAASSERSFHSNGSHSSAWFLGQRDQGKTENQCFFCLKKKEKKSVFGAVGVRMLPRTTERDSNSCATAMLVERRKGGRSKKWIIFSTTHPTGSCEDSRRRIWLLLCCVAWRFLRTACFCESNVCRFFSNNWTCCTQFVLTNVQLFVKAHYLEQLDILTMMPLTFWVLGARVRGP